jgi:acetyl-CoA C-acetyltransferase
VSRSNRAITQPGYPKLLNAIMNVDMSAAVILCSVGWARHHGVPETKWVFLHGCGDAYDLPPRMRARLDRSPAMHEAYRQAQSMAAMASGIDSLNRVDHFDIYSCFPSAVQVCVCVCVCVCVVCVRVQPVLIKVHPPPPSVFCVEATFDDACGSAGGSA